MTYEDVERARELAELESRLLFDLNEHDKMTLPGRGIARISRQRSGPGLSTVERHFYRREELEERLDKVRKELIAFHEEMLKVDNEEVQDIIYFRVFRLCTWKRIDAVFYGSRSGSRCKARLEKYFSIPRIKDRD